MYFVYLLTKVSTRCFSPLLRRSEKRGLNSRYAELRTEKTKMKYLHADVFSNKSLKGNGLTIIYTDNDNTNELQEIAKEFKQFETVFIYRKKEDYYPIRIFTVEEELDFAGHPILGASAAVLREKKLPGKLNFK